MTQYKPTTINFSPFNKIEISASLPIEFELLPSQQNNNSSQKLGQVLTDYKVFIDHSNSAINSFIYNANPVLFHSLTG